MSIGFKILKIFDNVQPPCSEEQLMKCFKILKIFDNVQPLHITFDR